MNKTHVYLDNETIKRIYEMLTSGSATHAEIANRYNISRAQVSSINTIFKRVATKDISKAALNNYARNQKLARVAGHCFGRSAFVEDAIELAIKQQDSIQIEKTHNDTTYEKSNVKNSYKQNPPTDGFHQESLIASELIKNMIEMNIRMSEKMNSIDGFNEEISQLKKEISQLNRTVDELIRLWK